MMLMFKRLLIASLALLLSIAKVAHAGDIQYVINDHLGTPQMLVDEQQNVVWEAHYSPFGEADLVVEQVEFNLRFPGQYYDEETGLHYNYFRDYDPSLGRYVQSDPIGLAGGVNTFAYVLNNPLAYLDPLGLAVTGEWTEYPRLDRSTLDANYIGWGPTLGVDKYLTLLMVRLNFQVSGNIVASVRCKDDCENKEWGESYSDNASTNEHIDLGVNIPASAGSVIYGVGVGALINAIVVDLKLNEGLQGLGKNLEAKAALLNAYGAELVCQKGWPKI